MEKRFKFVTSTPAKGIKPVPCPFPGAGMIRIADLVMVNEGARFDKRALNSPDPTIMRSMKANGFMPDKPVLVGYLPSILDGKTDWRMEIIDARQRTIAADALGMEEVPYVLKVDAHLLPDHKIMSIALATGLATVPLNADEIHSILYHTYVGILSDKKWVKELGGKAGVVKYLIGEMLLDPDEERYTTSKISLILDNWEKMSQSAKALIADNTLSESSTLRDLASLTPEQQDQAIVLAAKIEAATVEAKQESGTGGQTAEGISGDAVRLAKAALMGQALTSTASRSEERTEAAAKVLAEEAAKGTISKAAVARTGIVKADERDRAIRELQSWVGKAELGMTHEDKRIVQIIIAALRWNEKGEVEAPLEGIADGAVSKALRAMRQ